jgi:hypothetical protein
MKKKCFVIGPMNPKHLSLLKWLAKEVIGRILEKSEFEIFTPDVSVTGNIMNHIIRSCDRSQLVIADMTDNNPNVLYEIAVLDAMGRACIPVKIKDPTTKAKIKDNVPFDRAQYRFFEINPNDTKSSVKKLKPVIEDVLSKHLKGDLQSNPLSDFFKVPLSSFSSAHGLARSYYFNFVKPCIYGEIIDGPDFIKGKKNLSFKSIIPDKLIYASRQGVEKLLTKNIIIPISVNASGRKIGANIWSKEFINNNPGENQLTVIDIPTTLGTLRENVIARLGSDVNPDPYSEDFVEVEQDEIQQFVRYLKRFTDEESELLIHERFRIIITQNKFHGLFS